MKYAIILLAAILFCSTGYSQEMSYDVFGTYAKPIQQEQLDVAKSMVDINPDYPSSWIADSDYISSEIKATCDGMVMIEKGVNDKFTSSQSNILKKADLGSNIDIEVKYKVKNSITNNIDVKTMNFSVSLIPEKQAEYVGGLEKMREYLKENAVDKINESSNNKFEMAKVRFVVDEKGKTQEARLSQASGNKEIDDLLLETIANMPNWVPAQSVDGAKVRQEFDFVIGTMIGC